MIGLFVIAWIVLGILSVDKINEYEENVRGWNDMNMFRKILSFILSPFFLIVFKLYSIGHD